MKHGHWSGSIPPGVGIGLWGAETRGKRTEIVFVAASVGAAVGLEVVLGTVHMPVLSLPRRFLHTPDLQSHACLHVLNAPALGDAQLPRVVSAKAESSSTHRARRAVINMPTVLPRRQFPVRSTSRQPPTSRALAAAHATGHACLEVDRAGHARSAWVLLC